MTEVRLKCADLSSNTSSYGNPSNLYTFLSGIPPIDAATRHRMEMLEEEPSQSNNEIQMVRAWNRQLDDAYNEEAGIAAGLP